MFTKSKKVVSIVLALIMVLGMMPISAMAADPINSASQIQKVSSDNAYYTWNNSASAFENAPDKQPVTTNTTAQNVPKVTTSKTIAGTDTENVFEITLDVTTTQRVEETLSSPDAAVVLVVDLSGSMNYCVTCGSGNSNSLGDHANKCSARNGVSKIKADQTRLYASKMAAIAFLKEYRGSAKNADETYAARYVSTASFSSTATIKQNWVNIAQYSDNKIEDLVTAIIASSITSGYTNTNGGLEMAETLWARADKNSTNQACKAIAGIDNRFTVLLTDGEPNVPGTDPGMTYSYPNGHTPKTGSSDSAKSYNFAAKRAWSIGSNYKSQLYSIYLGSYNSSAGGTAPAGYSWLKSISDKCVAVNSSNGLLGAFSDIVAVIRLAVNAWKVTDLMGANMEYLGYSGTHNGNAVTGTPTLLTWDLRKDLSKANISMWNGGQWKPCDLAAYNAPANADKTFKIEYSLKYTVLFDNTAATADTFYKTNGRTYLEYYMTKENKFIDEKGNSLAEENALLKLDFKVPAVKSFFASLNINKLSNKGGAATAKFALYRVANKDFASAADLAIGGASAVKVYESTGLESTFKKSLPSGHTYALVEIATDSSHELDLTVYYFTVSMGKITLTTTGTGGAVVPYAAKAGTFTFTNTKLSPGVSVTKTANATTVPSAGGAVKYTITVSNTGPVEAEAVEVTDTLTVGGSVGYIISDLKFNGMAADLGVLEAFQVDKTFTHKIASLDATNGIYEITYTVTYDANDTAASITHSNLVQLSNLPEGNTTEEEDQKDNTEVKQPSVARGYDVQKTVHTINGVAYANETTVNPGDRIVYKVTLTYTSDVQDSAALSSFDDIFSHGTLTAYTAEDCQIPATLTGVINANTTTGSNKYSGTLDLYFTYTVAQEDAGDTLTNAAVFFGETDDAPELEVLSPDLMLTKTANVTEVSDDGEVTFTVTLANAQGAGKATGVYFIDTLTGDNVRATIVSATIMLDPATSTIDTFAGGSPAEFNAYLENQTFDLVGGQKAVLTYVVKVQGRDADEFAADLVALTKKVDDSQIAYAPLLVDVAAAETVRNDAQAAYQDAATAVVYAQDALNTCYNDLFTFYDAYGDDSSAYDQIAKDELNMLLESLSVLEIALLNAQAVDLDDLNATLVVAQEAYDVVVKAAQDGLDELNDAIAALNAAQDSYEDETEFSFGNTVTLGGGYTGEANVEDITVHDAKFNHITINKTINGEKILVRDYDAIGDVTYTITVTNYGNAAQGILLSDVFDGNPCNIEGVKSNETIELAAGETQNFTVTIQASSFASSDEIISKVNTATVTIGTDDTEGGWVYNNADEKSSSAVVVITPEPKPLLGINKDIRHSSDTAWSKSRPYSSNKSETFEFRFTITNYGNADSEMLTLKDVMTLTDKNGSAIVALNIVDADSESVSNFIVKAGETVTFTAQTSIEPGQTVNNTVTLLDGIGEELDQDILLNDESSAHGKVVPVAHSILSIEKQVQKTPQTWVDSVIFYSLTAKEVLFKISVTNFGDANGQFTLTDNLNGNPIDITDLWLDIDCTEPVTSDNLTVNANQSKIFYYKTTVAVDATATNVVTLSANRAYEEDSDAPYDTIFVDGKAQDDAKAAVTSAPVLTIEKKVADGKWNSDNVDNGNVIWRDTLELPNGGPYVVTYMLTITVTGLPDGQSIDVLISDAMWYDAGMKTVHEGDNVWYYTCTLEGDTVNVAKIESANWEEDGEVAGVGSEADAEVTIAQPSIPTPPPPPTIPITPEIVIDPEPVPQGDFEEEIIVPEEVPLADFTVEEEIFEEEVPLAYLPKTGDTTNTLPLIIAMMLSIAGTVVILGRRKEENAQ